MTTLLKYEVDFGSAISDSCNPIHTILLPFITEQGVKKGSGICERVSLRENMI
jgi:hypothetical protein